MSNTYVIQWKSKVNGRAGRGTKQFSRDEAEQLVMELNQEYPQILHEVVPWRPPPEPENEEQEQPAGEPHSEDRSGAHEHHHTHHSSPARRHKTEATAAATTPEFAIK